jgi:hypothetical protein
MTCRELSDFLREYFAEELPAGVSTEFEMHIEHCGNCGVFLSQYRQTIALGRSVGQHEALDVPEELIEAIVKSIRAAE